MGPGSMSGVLQALTALPRRGRGRAVMVMAARSGEGASTVARAVAEEASNGVTLLLDLELTRSVHHQHFRTSGPLLWDPIDARLKGRALYRIIDGAGRLRPEPDSALGFYRVGRTRLFVSGFNNAAMREGDRLQFATGSAYWDAVRQSCELAVIDAPALDRGRVGLSICAQMDGVVVVASGADGSVTATLGLKAALEAVGAFVMGVVYTRADRVALTLDRPLLG